MQKSTDNVSHEEEWACGDNSSSRHQLLTSGSFKQEERQDTSVTREEQALGEDSIDWIKMKKNLFSVKAKSGDPWAY